MFANAVFNVFTVVFDVMNCVQLDLGFILGRARDRDLSLFTLLCDGVYISLIEEFLSPHNTLQK